MEPLKLSFLGACREVGRSAILAHGSKRALMDCGVKINRDRDEYPLLDRGEARKLDSVILSHAHLDHTGYAPALYEQGFHGTTVMTKPTRDLVQALWADYLHLNVEEGAPFSNQDVIQLLKRTQLLEYDAPQRVSNFDTSFHEAGHILGSALIMLQDKGKRVLYTGDVNNKPSRLLEGCELNLEADTLIIESTYGSRADKHPARRDLDAAFIASIKKTLDRHGKVIIPTFAIGRGQEILFTIESFIHTGALPKVPIYMDGMVTKILRIYRHNAIYLKKELQHRILTSDDDPFKSTDYLVPQRSDKRDVFDQDRAIIITTSGMLNGGPVLDYLKELGPDKNNKLILVGYQAEGTKGRALLEGAREIRIKGERVDINLAVEQSSFSAHADHDGLMEFARRVRGLQKVFIVHGEGHKGDELAKDLEEYGRTLARKQRTGGRGGKEFDVVVPELGETYDA